MSYVIFLWAKNCISVSYILGRKSLDPSEACSSYFFDETSAPLTTMVSNGHHNTRPCPFSGRYSITGPKSALVNLLQVTMCFFSATVGVF